MPGLRTLQLRMLGYLRQMFRGPGDEVGRQAFPRLYDSQLETRRVMNADVPNAASQWLDVVLDAGTHANDGQADRFEIAQSQIQGRQEITVSINERQVWQGAAEQLQSLRLQGSSDSDQFIIDPAIQYAGVIFIDGGVNRSDAAADVIYVRPTGGESFHSVTVQDRPGTMQLRYSLVDSDSESSASSHAQTLWQVSHVSQIVDYTMASQRDFVLAHQDTWQLTSTHDEDDGPLLQLSSTDQRYEFIAPTSGLHLSNQSTNAQQLLLRDLDLSSIGYVRLEGDRFDSIVQQRWLGSSRHFSVATGSVELQGMIHSSSATQLTVHGSSIIQSGLIQLGSGSSAAMDSGPTGRTIIQGQLKILGDEQHAGGSITITGGIVRIDDHALIDVSGIGGGGKVLIGGDRAGANPLIRNAQHTTVSAGARISADALAWGNGGRIIVYATDRAIVDNASGLSARGGSLSGHGGFIETSGKRHLTLNGSPIVSATAGRAGQWLIDPEAVSIVTAVPAIPDPNITYITVASLQTLINAGGDVIIQTTTVNPALGDIVIEAAVLATPGVSARLILQAARDIVFNDSFTGNANLGLELEASRDVDALAVSITGINYLKIQSGRDVYLDDTSIGSGSANAGTALDIVAIDTIDLSGDLITTGGHITLSASRLLVDGTALRTIASGGSGVTAGTAGNINLSGLTEIDGSVSPADLTIDARGVLNGGTVRLASVSNTVQGIRNLTVDTRGATTTGQLILDNGIAASTTIVVTGNLNFANVDTRLADNVVLTTQQNTSTLTLGSVSTDGSARNLQLTSDANINITTVNLTGGTFTAQVDANNDGINAFTSTGALAAGSLQFNGSAANNDTLAAQSTLTSTVGAIAFNNFSLIQLAGDSTSQTSFTATNVTTVSLLSNADVFASGAINLDSTVTAILLGGASGSQNILDASGTNAAINLAAVTSTNSNVDLAIRSDRSVTLKSITLNGAQVDVQFSRNNPANDSIASFTTTVTCDGLTVTGASRTNDGVGFVAPVSLGAAGLSVTQVAGTLIAGSITTTTGNLIIASDNSTGLAGDLTTAGGNITLSGASLYVEGSAPRTITSGGNGLTANTAGNIDLSGLLAIDGAVSPADLTINARGVLNGGTVRLAAVTNTTFGIRNLTVDTRGSSTTGQLILDNGIAGSTNIVVSGNLNFANANTSLADNVLLTTQGNTSNLTLGSVVTDGAARNLQLVSDANINTGSVNLTGGSLTVQVDANNDGIQAFTSTGAVTASSLQFSGSAANNDTLAAQNNLTSTVGAIAFNNFSLVQLAGDSTSQTSFTATNVTTVELGSNADIFTTGAINLDSTVTGILLGGTSGTQNILDATGTNAAINLAAITATNSNVDLAIRSDRSVTLKSITLSGAQVDVQFSRNNPANDSSANFTAAVTSDGLTVTGAARTNDTVVFSSPLNLGAAGLNVAQVATTQVNDTITTTTGDLSITTATWTTLANNLSTSGGSITINGNLILVNDIVLTKQGNSGQLTLGSVVTDGAARNLQLISDANINTGSINLAGGSFTAQVDANNDGVHSFTSTGAVSASTLQFNGSAANNDTLAAQNNLTSTVDGIAFNNFSLVQLSGDSTSQTNFTATNVATVELGSNADIFTTGAINLDSTVTGILLGGTSGTQNILDATGTNAAINLAAITATNSNVDLAIRSDRSVTLKSITLNGAQVDVQFSRNNLANDSSANFTATVTSDGLTVTGAARTNDTATFSSPLNLGTSGLSVTQVATTQVNGPITTTTGNLTINSATLTTLAGNLTTAGGNIALSGARLLVDGSAPRTIASGGSGVTANTAGNINLSGLTEIDGSVAPADLTINARGLLNGGTVRLASVNNAVQGIRNLTVDTRGASTTGQLILDNGIAASTTIVVSGNLNFANANTQLADNVVLTTQGNTSTLTLGSVATDGVARNLQLTSDANINTDSVNLTGGSLTAQVDANNDGIQSFTSTGVVTAGSLQFNGSVANNDTLSAQSNLSSTVGGINLNNFSKVQLDGDSTSQTSFTATNVATVELGSGADIFTTGAINLDSTVTGILLAGTSGTQNILDATGTGAAINLATVTATNSDVDLAIRSDRSVTLKSITLNGAQVDVQFSRNNPANDSSANFTAAVTSDGLSVTGATRTNDSLVFSSPLNLGAAGLNVSQVATVEINADINATGPVVINQVSNRIQLIQNGRIIASGNINLRTGVSLIELSGASGTLNQISSSGDSATVQLANTTSALGVNLDVLSNHSIVLGSVDLGTTGSLRLEIDRNNNNASSQLTADALRAHSVIVLGSANQDDTAVFSGTLRSEVGSISLSQFATVTINSDLTSATSVVVSNIAQQLRLGTSADLLASNGNLNLLLGTGQIVSTGTAGSANILDARGAMNLSSLSSLNSVQIVLLANSEIQLAGADLPGSLSITAGNNGALAGQIESSSRLTAASLTLTSATGIGSTNELLTGASSLSATNRISGDIRIGNQRSNTDVLQLRAEAGGDILFNQTGGPATFHRVESFADGTPAVDENRVELSVTGADLSVATTGLIANGIGRVNLKTVNSGSISLQADTLAEGSDVLMQSAANILGTGLISGKTIRFEASSAIGGLTALRTQTTQLSSLTVSGTTNIANSSAAALNVSELRSQSGGAILLRQTGGGDALIGSIVTGASSVSGAPNILVINDAGSLIVNGMISAGGQGAINLQSQVDLVLSSTSLLATHSESALIEGTAAGRIQFQTGAVVRAGTGTPATEAVMTQIPPLVTVMAVINSIGVNLDTDGLGVIDILLLPSGIGILDQNYVVIIDWGGGEIDRLPLGPLNANTPATGIARFDASLVPYRISHLYLQNPNTSDPTADIPVRVTAQVDSLNRIRFTDSQAIDQQFSASADTLLVVPSTGLVSLYFVLPQTPTIQKQLAFARDNTELPPPLALANDRSELVANTSTTSSVQQQRKIVLRVMIPVDEFGRVEASKDPKDDIALSPEDLTNLDSLFERLSDNRYRIYLIMEDGNEILLKDILLRNHQPAEVEDRSNLSEIDHSQIPLLDDSPPASERVKPSVQSGEANSAGLFDESDERQPVVEESTGMFRSWRKAARRFRAG